MKLLLTDYFIDYIEGHGKHHAGFANGCVPTLTGRFGPTPSALRETNDASSGPDIYPFVHFYYRTNHAGFGNCVVLRQYKLNPMMSVNDDAHSKYQCPRPGFPMIPTNTSVTLNLPILLALKSCVTGTLLQHLMLARAFAAPTTGMRMWSAEAAIPPDLDADLSTVVVAKLEELLALMTIASLVRVFQQTESEFDLLVKSPDVLSTITGRRHWQRVYDSVGESDGLPRISPEKGLKIIEKFLTQRPFSRSKMMACVIGWTKGASRFHQYLLIERLCEKGSAIAFSLRKSKRIGATVYRFLQNYFAHKYDQP